MACTHTLTHLCIAGKEEEEEEEEEEREEEEGQEGEEDRCFATTIIVNMELTDNHNWPLGCSHACQSS